MVNGGLPTKEGSHELRELRESNKETTYFAKEATARITRSSLSLLFSRNLLFLCRLPVL
jgi:hypothetical protein